MIRLLLLIPLLLAGCTTRKVARDDGVTEFEKSISETAGSESARLDNRGESSDTQAQSKQELATGFGVIIESSVVAVDEKSDDEAAPASDGDDVDIGSPGKPNARSVVVRYDDGSFVGAAAKESLNLGQAFEYVIRRDNDVIVTTTSRSNLSVGDCLFIYESPVDPTLMLEIADASVCEEDDGDFRLPDGRLQAAKTRFDQLSFGGEEGIRSTSQSSAVRYRPYLLNVNAVPVKESVRFRVQTDIPGEIKLTASVDRKGGALGGYIGKSQIVSVVGGVSVFAIPVSELPDGDYEAVLTFDPLWGFQDDESRATGINYRIQSKVDLTLSGSAE